MELKRKIIQESLRLFSSHGFESTSLKHILTAAGTSKGGFYNHFKSKEELCRAVLAEARTTWQQRNLEGLDEIDLPLDKLHKLLDNYRYRYLGDNVLLPGGCVFINLAVELDGQLGQTMPDLTKEVHEGFSRLQDMIRRLLQDAQTSGEVRPDVDCEMAASIVFTGMLGSSIVHGMTKSGLHSDLAIENLKRYLNHLGPR